MRNLVLKLVVFATIFNLYSASAQEGFNLIVVSVCSCSKLHICISLCGPSSFLSKELKFILCCLPISPDVNIFLVSYESKSIKSSIIFI